MTTHNDSSAEGVTELPPIANANYALATLWDIFGDIDNLLDSLDEDFHKDRPELFAKFSALGQFLAKH